MKYISGIQALNLPCSLNTDGDWHTSAINWKTLDLKESDTSFFFNYGIELNKKVPTQGRCYHVANHIRALLDLLIENEFPLAQGMRDDFINDDRYTNEVFDKVWQMRILPNWPAIDDFLGKEYMRQWLNYKQERFIHG